MSLRVVVEPEASAELEGVASWYEHRHTGLGLAFLGAVDQAIEHLGRWPHAGTPITEMPPDILVRQVPVPRFPYHVVYLITPEEIRVLAFAHDRRRPGYWYSRTL